MYPDNYPKVAFPPQICRVCLGTWAWREPVTNETSSSASGTWSPLVRAGNQEKHRYVPGWPMVFYRLPQINKLKQALWWILRIAKYKGHSLESKARLGRMSEWLIPSGRCLVMLYSFLCFCFQANLGKCLFKLMFIKTQDFCVLVLQ